MTFVFPSKVNSLEINTQKYQEKKQVYLLNTKLKSINTIFHSNMYIYIDKIDSKRRTGTGIPPATKKWYQERNGLN